MARGQVVREKAKRGRTRICANRRYAEPRTPPGARGACRQIINLPAIEPNSNDARGVCGESKEDFDLKPLSHRNQGRRIGQRSLEEVGVMLKDIEKKLPTGQAPQAGLRE